MLESNYLNSNPNLNIFLPLLYIVWSDAVLTPSEIKVITNSIEQQKWLSVDEKNFLFEQINPASPPSPDEFRNWLSEIRKALDTIPVSSNLNLVDIGIALAQLKSATALRGEITEVRTSLAGLDETLGLIHGEVVYLFYPEKRTTITEQHSTQSTFSINALAKILDGEAESASNHISALWIPDLRFACPEGRCRVECMSKSPMR